MLKKYDCTKTLDYAHERNRMCNFCYLSCENCPMYKFDNYGCKCNTIRDITADRIAIVQKWSNEHPERPDRLELNVKQKEILQALKTLGYKYIAKDSDKVLFAYLDKPVKHSVDWSVNTSPERSLGDHFECFDHLNNLCSWSDDEPTSIDDLLADAEENK